jgi:hypothetical protein
MNLCVSPVSNAWIGLIIATAGLAIAGSRDAIAQTPAEMNAMHLAAGEQGRRVFLQSNSIGQLFFSRQPIGVESAWYITPVAQDMVRIQQSIGGRWFALGLDSVALNNPGPMGPQVGFFPIGNSAQQLWRIQSLNAGGYWIESVGMPGVWLTCGQNGGLWLQPLVNSPYQVWWPQQPSFPLPIPQYRNVAEQYVPNPPLSPANLRVNNTHTDTLFILLSDRRTANQMTKLRIPAAGSQTITLQRDAGGTIVQTIEMADALGNWDRYEYQIPVPPSILYDMSVYEEFLQSIAIDRTGKSPNVIEDVNYQPRSVGFFLLPAGDALPESGAIDAYGAAVEANNPGAVRRIPKKDLPNSSSQQPPRDPLKDLLDQIQSKRGKF